LQTNFVNPLDSNGDDSVNPLDVLAVIDLINTGLSSTVSKSFNNTNRWADTNGDGVINPLDVLRVIDYLNAMGSSIAAPIVRRGASQSGLNAGDSWLY